MFWERFVFQPFMGQYILLSRFLRFCVILGRGAMTISVVGDPRQAGVKFHHTAEMVCS